MTYIIIEMQTNAGSTAVVTPATYTDRNQAENAYHYALASAAVSNVETHAVSMLTEDGRVVRQECYRHPAPTPNEET